MHTQKLTFEAIVQGGGVGRGWEVGEGGNVGADLPLLTPRWEKSG